MPRAAKLLRVAQRPLIAVTMGDPGGIGPEVAVLASAARRFAADGKTPMVEVSSLSAAERRAGKPTPAGAEAAYRAILRAVELVQGGEADAIVTAPVSKHAIQSLGIDFPGHTEVIAHLAGD